MTQPENKAPEGELTMEDSTRIFKAALKQYPGNFPFDITRFEAGAKYATLYEREQLRAEVDLYLKRMSDQEATIREMSELKQSWKARIKELEAVLMEANKLIDWYEGNHKATKP